MSNPSRLALLLGLACSAPSLSYAQDWPTWRGPNGDGTTPVKEVATEWSAEQGVRWKTPLAQPANGSPIVAKGRVFLTMAEDDEGKRRSLYCYDREDGKELWVQTVDFGKKMPTHQTNPYCGTTPVSDGERVVVWHGSAGLWCYDLDGKEQWHKDLGEFRHIWGYGTSPVLHEGKVILHTGPGDTSFVASFDLATGEEVWRTVEPQHLTAEEKAKERLAGSWCTPIVHPMGDRHLVLCSQPSRFVAYDANDGSIVWSCDGFRANNGDLTYGSPTIAGDTCVLLGGYSGPVLGVRLDAEAKGDITESHRLYQHMEQLSNCASGIAVDGNVYVPDMRGTLWCIDVKTGEALWKERVARGGTWGSVVRVGDLLYLMAQDGTTVVFEPNPKKLVVVARNELGEETNSTPAIADGELFLRTHEHLYCIAKPD